MGVGYYDTLLPAREPGAGLPGMLAGIVLPYRALASVSVPAGRIVLAFVSDSARLSRMFAATYSRALSERGRGARMLVAPDSVYGPAWSTAATVVDQVAVVVREPAGWLPPGREDETVKALESEDDVTLIHHHEAFFNGSLILTAEHDKLREERRYRQLFNRTTVSWINNCSTPETLVDNFIGAIMNKR